jgi:uncharacterized membrane protein YedE/YeeE
MQVVLAFPLGLLFGLGLLISGMSNPAKVLNFFDLAGTWDPSLALVMLGALVVTTVGYRIVLRWQQPILAPHFHLPKVTAIDPALVIGSALFGIGWGLSGFCPGGLIPALGTGRSEPFIFCLGLLAGLTAARIYRARATRISTEPSQIEVRQ